MLFFFEAVLYGSLWVGPLVNFPVILGSFIFRVELLSHEDLFNFHFISVCHLALRCSLLSDSESRSEKAL